MADPWAFGWAPLLTIVGFVMTATIAFVGFRTFEKWRRERIEEKRIDVAFEALEVAYQTKFIFQNIRSPLAESWEWAKMERLEGESEENWNRRGPFYAAFERIKRNKDFFERVWKLQPKCMAVFGPTIEHTFMNLHQARRHIEVAAQMLAQRVNERHEPADQATRDLYKQLRRDMSDHGDHEKEKDRVAKFIADFVSELESKARPLVDREYSRTRSFLGWNPFHRG